MLQVHVLVDVTILFTAQRTVRIPRGADSTGSPGSADTAAELELADLAEVAGIPAWRDLWYGSLDALRREPTINNTQEDVVAQLGALVFLHCPVRNLGERGVSLTPHSSYHQTTYPTHCALASLVGVVGAAPGLAHHQLWSPHVH